MQSWNGGLKEVEFERNRKMTVLKLEWRKVEITLRVMNVLKYQSVMCQLKIEFATMINYTSPWGRHLKIKAFSVLMGAFLYCGHKKFWRYPLAAFFVHNSIKSNMLYLFDRKKAVSLKDGQYH